MINEAFAEPIVRGLVERDLATAKKNLADSRRRGDPADEQRDYVEDVERRELALKLVNRLFARYDAVAILQED